ncbi:MAG: IclR family transcriptional regulator, partial [Streptosporangiaceae bacterium]
RAYLGPSSALGPRPAPGSEVGVGDGARLVTPAGPGGGPGDGAAQGLSTVRNAARLLKVFRSRETDLGVSELARRLGLGKSTVHRLLTTLASEGLIEQNPRTGGYRLGLMMFELGQAVRVHMDLHAAVGPVLGDLRAQTGESSQVGVLDGDEVVYVDRLESAHSLRLFTETGRRVPVHCTSSGKVLLAHLPEARRHAVLRAIPLTALTPHTITDRDRFAAELARVRRRGWAEAVNEREIGVASIAAPIHGAGGEVVAAISIGVPLARCSVMALRRLAPTIMEAAEAASRRLGWSPELASPELASPELALELKLGREG